MDKVLQKITEWLKEILVGGVMGNLSGMFDSVNEQVGEIGEQVSLTPAEFSPRVFEMVQGVSESAILPIAGIFLTIVACYELIQMVIDHNNLANFETWTFFRWVFKTFVAVTLISNTFDITMAVFDLAQTVVAESSGIIAGNTAVDDTTLLTLQTSLMTLELGELLALYLQSFLIGFTMKILGIAIFVIVYGRMVEIYLAVSLAPIPVLDFWQQRAGPDRPELPAQSAGSGFAGLSHHDLRRHLRGAHPGRFVCIRPHRIHLGCHWVHRPALLHPAQDRHSRPQHPQRTLTPCTYYKRRTTWQPIFPSRGT